MRLVKKTTKKLSLDDTSTLMGLVHSAIRKDSEFYDRCERFRSMLAGEQWGKDNDKNRSYAKLTINLMHAHVRSLLPSIFFKDPYLECLPQHPDQAGSAMAWEGYLNHIIERTAYKKETKEIVMDSLVYGEGWKKWVVQKEADTEEIESGDEVMNEAEQSSGALAEGPSKGPSAAQNINAPVGYRISPTQVITESKTRTLEDSRFVAVRYQKLMSELIADSRYDFDKTAADMLGRKMDGTYTSHHVINEGQWDDDTQVHKDLVGKDRVVTIYEVWIYQLVDLGLYKQVVTLMEDHPEPIRQPEPWSEFCGVHCYQYPFNRLTINDIPDAPPASELGLIKSLQQATNWLMSRFTAMVENQKQIYAVHNGLMKDPKAARRQFASKNIREFVELNSAAEASPRPAIEPIPQQPVPRDDHMLLNVVQTYFQQLTGFGQNRRGSAGIRTAREATIIEAATQVKLDEKVDSVGDFVKRDAEILVRILRAITDPGFVFRLRGNAGPIKWGQFTHEEAAWSPDVRVRPSSFRSAVTEERAQMFQVVMNIGLQLYNVYGPRIRLDAVFREFMEEIGVQDPERFLTDVLDDERKQMIELIQMANGEEAPVLPDDNHAVEARATREFINSPIFLELTEESQALIHNHLSGHEEFLREQPQLQGQQFPGNNEPGPNPEDLAPSPEEGAAF